MANEVTIKVSGPLLSATMPSTLKHGIRAGLFEVAAEITGTVQEQLVSGHGWVTGRLRGSIGARQFSDLGYEVQSGAVTGQPVVYAYWVETGKQRGRQTRFPGYHMFENAANQWRNNPRVDLLMGKAIKRALS